MAVAFRSAGTLVAHTSGTPIIPYPAGVAAGDLLVIQLGCVNSVTPGIPAGWTRLFGPTAMSGGGNNDVAHLFYRVAGASEPGSVTFTNTGSNNWAAGIMTAYTGADTTTPIDVSATAVLPTTGTTATTPSVTTTKANAMLLRAYWDWSGSATVAPPGTDAERYDTFEANLNLVFQLATSAQATAGASGTTTATFSGATSGGLGATIAVAPVGSTSSTTGFEAVILAQFPSPGSRQRGLMAGATYKLRQYYLAGLTDPAAHTTAKNNARQVKALTDNGQLAAFDAITSA